MERLEDIAARNALLGFTQRPDPVTASADYLFPEAGIDPVSTVRALVSLQRFSGTLEMTTTEPVVFTIDVQNAPQYVTVNVNEMVLYTSSAAFSALGQASMSGTYIQQVAPMLAFVDDAVVGLGAGAPAFLEYFERYFKSPFKQIEEARERHLSAVIESIGVAYHVPYAETLRQRLRDLLEYWDEDHGAEEQLSIDALSGLLTFLSAHMALKMPEIVTTAAGTWIAQWRRDADHVFNVHFIDATMARFSIVAREPRAKPGAAQSWGSVEISGVLDIAKAFRADKWMTREG